MLDMRPFFDTEVLYATSRIQDGNMSFTHDEPALVVAQRKGFLENHGVYLEECVALTLEHDEKILLVGEKERGKGMRIHEEALCADALITNTPQIFLFLMTGDCFPLAYHDPIQKVVAVAHLGWKPTEKKLAAKVVQKMQEEFGSEPRNIKVAIGPGIHSESYHFKDPVQKGMPFWSPYLLTDETGETHIDLLSALQDQLSEAGIVSEHVWLSPVDTATSTEYFSHYRDVRTGAKEGRFVTVVGLT